MTETTEITLYNGVNIEQAAYMAAFSQAGGLQDIIAQIQQQATSQAEGLTADTATGRKKIASIAYSVAQAKTAIDGTGKDLVADAKAKIKIVDNNRKDVRDQLDDLKDTIRRPVTEYEEAEKAKVEAMKAVFDRLESLSAPIHPDGSSVDSATFIARLEEVKQLQAIDHGDFAAEIREKTTETVLRLESMIATAKEHEKRQAEIEKLRAEQAAREQVEREARIAADAAEKARIEAEAKASAEKEAAERARIEAQLRAEQAERDKQAAIERAEAVLRLKSMIAEAAEKEQAEAKRAADIEHQRTINRAIIAALSVHVDDDQAKSILTAMVRGNIPHIKICY